MKKAKEIKVNENEQPLEVIADSIIAIAEGIKILRNSRLNDKALLLLIAHATPRAGAKYSKFKVGTTEIKAVLVGIENLKRAYLK